MTKQKQISRRCFIKKGTQAAALIPLASLSVNAMGVPRDNSLSRESCSELLRTWCDGLVAVQNAGHGGLLCPACQMVHGRSFDAIHPLLHVAHATGEAKYMEAAIRLQSWSESLSLPNGCWLSNFGGQWHETTRLNALTLADALRYHGDILDAKTRARWSARLARATTFLDGLMLPAASGATPRLVQLTQQELDTFAANTRQGLLYKAPCTSGQDALPCIQDTVNQAKALASMLDRG